MKSERRPKAIAVIIVFICLVAFLVYSASWAAKKAAGIEGPSLIAADSLGNIWIVLNSEILVLDADGRLTRILSQKEIGIDPPFCDIAPMSNGRILVTNGQGKVRKIVLAPSYGQFMELPSASPGRLGSFHLFFNADNNEILMTDTMNHRVVALDEDGRMLRDSNSLGTPSLFNFPNTVAVDKHGRILVSDTNHHIVKILSQTFQELGYFDPVGANDFTWPVFMGQDKAGRLYITVHDDNLEKGSLVRFNTDGVVEFTYSLPSGTEPRSICVRERDILILDGSTFNVFKLSVDGATLSSFGDRAFVSKVDEARKLIRTYTIIEKISQIAVFAAFIVVLAMFVYERRRGYRTSLSSSRSTHRREDSKGRTSSLEFGAAGTMAQAFPELALPLVAAVLISTLHPYSMDYQIYTFAAGVILSVALVLSSKGSAMLRTGLQGGKYSGNLQVLSEVLLHRFRSIIGTAMIKGRNIRLCLLGMVGHEMALVISTGDELVIVALRRLPWKPMRVQKIDLHSAKIVAFDADQAGKWISHGIVNLEVHKIVFKLSGRDGEYELAFFSREDAVRVLAEFTCDGGGAVGPVQPIVEYCSMCGGRIADGGGCGSCYETYVSRSILLSVLLPGLGHLYNGRLSKGAMFGALFLSALFVFFKPLIATYYRTSEVPSLYLLYTAGLCLAVWLYALLDTLAIVKSAKPSLWGLK